MPRHLVRQIAPATVECASSSAKGHDGRRYPLGSTATTNPSFRSEDDTEPRSRSRSLPQLPDGAGLWIPKPLLCLAHSNGNPPIKSSSCSSAGCRPSRIASTNSGASSVNRRIRLASDGATPFARARSSSVACTPPVQHLPPAKRPRQRLDHGVVDPAAAAPALRRPVSPRASAARLIVPRAAPCPRSRST